MAVPLKGGGYKGRAIKGKRTFSNFVSPTANTIIMKRGKPRKGDDETEGIC